MESTKKVLDFETLIEAKGIKREYEETDAEDVYCTECVKLHYKHVKGTRCLSNIEKKILTKQFLVKPTKSYKCDQCDKSGFPTFNKLKKHEAKFHRTPSATKAILLINDGLKEYTKNTYSTKLADQSELKMNVPSNLKTYTRTKKPCVIIRRVKKEEEEPEFIVPD